LIVNQNGSKYKGKKLFYAGANLSREEIFHLPNTDPEFLTRVMQHVLMLQKDHPLAQLLDLEAEAALSSLFDLSKLQDSASFRALSRARLISVALIDEKGEIKKEALKDLLSLYEKEGFIFYPTGDSDAALTLHTVRVLRELSQEGVIKSLRRFQRPLCHSLAEKLIFETLGIVESDPPTEAHIRRAVLSAALTPLRQSVGSCFATAPAILIQQGQLTLFFEDLYQLLFTGKLKRTFGGVEYAIPLSPSTGLGDLKKNLLDFEKSGSCPGLIVALETAGVLPIERPLQGQGEKVQALIRKFAAGKTRYSAQELMHACLLEKYSLTEEELAAGKALEISQIKRGGFDSSSARKMSQIAEFEHREKAAWDAFKGMSENALLKAWEFTLASFSEVKMEFSRWNLYSSLGFDPKEPGGLGALIYQILDEKIAAINKKLESAQKEYEIAFDQLRAVESLLRNVSSESEGRRLQAEYQSRSYQMRSCQELRDALYTRGSQYSKLFSFLLKQYDEKFPEYFQEIYDAQMSDFQGELYEDSPAGFRLVYKHGRTDPSLWTLIDSAQQYIDALSDFFSMTETPISASCDWEGGEEDVLALTAAIISHIRTKEFLETAMHRMARAHQTAAIRSPLSNLQNIEKKPWAYTSGGTMTTLLKTYYCREKEFTSQEKWVENESELLIFILDAIKNLSPVITDRFLSDENKGMLITSPSHAFILLPGQEHFRKGWKEEIFTYTWVRDELFVPCQRFYSQIQLDSGQQTFLLSEFCKELPSALGSLLDATFRPKEKKMGITQWRQAVLESIYEHAKTLPLTQKDVLADKVDSFLYENLPVIEGREWKAIARRILSDLFSEKVENALALFPDVPCPFLTAAELRTSIKGCYLLAAGTPFLSFDLHQYVAKHGRFVGASQPTPLLFADSNWAFFYLGFVVNPGTGRLELWRLDRTLSRGAPMSQWKPWISGFGRKTWEIFTHPHEYEGLLFSSYPKFS
jgi:hypothetical protein